MKPSVALMVALKTAVVSVGAVMFPLTVGATGVPVALGIRTGVSNLIFPSPPSTLDVNKVLKPGSARAVCTSSYVLSS